MGKVALLLGATGQDGHYLSAVLENKGYTVVGTSRKEICSGAQIHMDPMSRRSVDSVIKEVGPDVIYNMLGPSSVGKSFDNHKEYVEDVIIFTSNILESISRNSSKSRYVLFSSTECFGDSSSIITEQSPLLPVSPYGIGKMHATLMTEDFQRKICASVAFLGNHESPLRPPHFVTRKIVDGARAIYEGRQSLLELGNLEVVREWGLSSDYMEAISRVGSLERPARLIISSGKPKKLKEFVERVFGRFNLDYKKFVVYNKELGRKWEIKKTHCDVTQAKLLIDWEATCGIEEIVDSYLYPPPPQQ